MRVRIMYPEHRPIADDMVEREIFGPDAQIIRRTSSPNLPGERGRRGWWRAAVLFATLVGSAGPASAASVTSFPELLPLPAPAPAPTTPAPLAPPINPGYAAAPADGLSPLLSESVPLYQYPQPASPSYPPPQLPGPIDQQKMQAYRNSLLSQQWQMQSQGLGLGSTLRGREILQQLNAPDAQ